MHISQFDANGLKSVIMPTDLKILRQGDGVTWIDLHDPDSEQLERLQEVFGFHPLAVEDTRNRRQRPKVEEYEDHLFIIANNADLYEGKLHFHEIDIFMGRNYIVTVHSNCLPLVEEVRARMRMTNTFKLVSTEYLLYILLDTIVDRYLPLLDDIDDEMEQMGEVVFDKPDQEMLRRLFELKRMLNELWRVVQHQRGMFSILTRREEDLITHHDVLEYYLRDVDDHLIRINDMTSVLRDNLDNIVQLYVSSTSNRLNRVVNRLTVITVIIGVLTVIGGFYGMNFEHTWPPFNADWGTGFVIMLMLALAGGVTFLFKRWDFF